MRVETVGFITRVRLPDGRHETTISLQNQHHKLSYEVFVDPKIQTVTVKSIKTPSWTCLIPMANCAFISLESTPMPRKKAPKVPNSVDAELIRTTVVKKARPRVRPKG